MTQIFKTIKTGGKMARGTKGFGVNSPDSTYQDFGHYPLIDMKPIFDRSTQRITSIEVTDEVNRVVNVVYTIIDLTQEELDARLKASIPKTISMRQARLILLRNNLLLAVEGFIVSLPSPQKEEALIEWEFASTVERDSVLANGIIQGLGITDAELDNMFLVASVL